MATDKLHFDVHPSVVYQLGESLISDAVQALIELVKNCYDADATYAKVTIDTAGAVDVPGSIFPPSGGRVVVEDDGLGMDRDDIESGWLLISSRRKRELKEAKETTPGGRTPLGDKGLGRLGVQRLGENLEVFTKCKGGSGYHFGFSWLDFATAPTLQSVDIHFQQARLSWDQGTKIVVSSLRELDVWRGEQPTKRLEHELSRMISPYKEIRDFDVVVSIDGKPLELREISDKIRDIAPVRYSITFDGDLLTIKGKARLDFFRPAKRQEAEEFSLLVESDNGDALFEFLRKQGKAGLFSLSRARGKQWYVEFGMETHLSDIDKVQRDPANAEKYANPGPFLGEVDSFDLGQVSFEQQSVFDRIKAFRDHIKELSGIRVYRDGFAIRVDSDWLGLGTQWTSATSYYGLKPDNTLGYIALSARENMALEETTDREGFKDTPYYRNFFSLLCRFRAFTTEAHGFFGRSWTEFRKQRNEEIAQVDARRTVEDISQTIRKSLTEAASHHEMLDAVRARLEASAGESRSVAAKLASATTVTPQLRQRAIETLSSLQPLVEEANASIAKLSAYLDELSALRGMGQVLQDRVDGLRRQMDDMYETVALGITAEALSHEVFNVADQLARRAKAAQTSLNNRGVGDRAMLSFIEHVHSAVMALRKQMSYLSPALRYVRERREDIGLLAFLEELQKEFYQERLAKSGIKLTVVSKDDASFTVRMNRGKLVQVIDNFMLNSEYWLREDIAQKRLTDGTITFEVDRPFLRIWDNGRGIDPTVEGVLFQPFVSAKARGQGRGLGLFIVKQLLDSEACSVGILPERNRHRRLYKFQIDLRGALNE